MLSRKRRPVAVVLAADLRLQLFDAGVGALERLVHDQGCLHQRVHRVRRASHAVGDDAVRIGVARVILQIGQAIEQFFHQFLLLWCHTACMGLSLSSEHRAIFVVLCHSILLFDPRREHSSGPTAYFHRRRAQRRSRTALLQRRRRPVLDGREHGGRLPAIGWLAAR